jgi:photosystem II stability/assembly factor-like uncharacterized protein
VGTKDAGLYKSTDAGTTWKSMGFASGSVGSIAIDPGDPNIIYASISADGVFKSINGGEDWVQKLDISGVYILITDPKDPDIVYAGTPNSKIYKSINGGDSWVQSTNGLIASNLTSLAVTQSNPEVLYAGTDSGVFKSVDKGENWFKSTDGLGDQWVYTIAVDPDSANIVYSGTFDQGVFKTEDSGANWSVYP